MWVKVDENFPEHPKVLKAGQLLGVNGCARVVAVWLEALCYANRYLTDGFISNSVGRGFHLDPSPIKVLRVLASRSVGLLIKVRSGFRFHDYEDYQFSKVEIEEKRRKERDRKRRVRAMSARDTKPRPHNVRSSDPIRSDPSLKDQDQEEQSASRTTHKSEDENPRVLLKLAHAVLDDLKAGRPGHTGERLTPQDVPEELKFRAARARVAYDARRIRRALDSVEVQRQ